jgi:C-terminal processing protease CtpA/Prc
MDCPGSGGWCIGHDAVAGDRTEYRQSLRSRSAMAAVFGMVKRLREPVDEKKLITDAISGMVAGLDPHSQYFDKKSWKEFREGTTGRFVGVGIEIGMEDGLVKVVSPIEGSPAFRAGLKSGDLITKIGRCRQGLEPRQAVAYAGELGPRSC